MWDGGVGVTNEWYISLGYPGIFAFYDHLQAEVCSHTQSERGLNLCDYRGVIPSYRSQFSNQLPPRAIIDLHTRYTSSV